MLELPNGLNGNLNREYSTSKMGHHMQPMFQFGSLYLTPTEPLTLSMAVARIGKLTIHPLLKEPNIGGFQIRVGAIMHPIQLTC